MLLGLFHFFFAITTAVAVTSPILATTTIIPSRFLWTFTGLGQSSDLSKLCLTISLSLCCVFFLGDETKKNIDCGQNTHDENQKEKTSS
jgi:hypothetical protein